MHIVVASSSAHRQTLYRDAIEGLGYQVATASGGVECIECLRSCSAALLLLEAPLLWGGSDGVLDIVQHEVAGSPPVILVAVGSGSIDWFQLSRFRVDDFLFRVPTSNELEQAICSLLGKRDLRPRADAINKTSGEAGCQPGLPQRSAMAVLSCDRFQVGVAS
jgi:hypothetical protein